MIIGAQTRSKTPKTLITRCHVWLGSYTSVIHWQFLCLGGFEEGGRTRRRRRRRSSLLAFQGDSREQEEKEEEEEEQADPDATQPFVLPASPSLPPSPSLSSPSLSQLSFSLDETATQTYDTEQQQDPDVAQCANSSICFH